MAPKLQCYLVGEHTGGFSGRSLRIMGSSQYNVGYKMCSIELLERTQCRGRSPEDAARCGTASACWNVMERNYS